MALFFFVKFTIFIFPTRVWVRSIWKYEPWQT